MRGAGQGGGLKRRAYRVAAADRKLFEAVHVARGAAGRAGARGRGREPEVAARRRWPRGRQPVGLGCAPRTRQGSPLKNYKNGGPSAYAESLGRRLRLYDGGCAESVDNDLYFF